jgi:hypothetical protein
VTGGGRNGHRAWEAGNGLRAPLRLDRRKKTPVPASRIWRVDG